MMTYEESLKLEIPEAYKDRPNFYRLARIIQSTGNSEKILAAMEVLFSAAGIKEGKV